MDPPLGHTHRRFIGYSLCGRPVFNHPMGLGRGCTCVNTSTQVQTTGESRVPGNSPTNKPSTGRQNKAAHRDIYVYYLVPFCLVKMFVL